MSLAEVSRYKCGLKDSQSQMQKLESSHILHHVPESGVFPILPVSKSFPLKIPHKNHEFLIVRGTRLQLPITGAYALTDYKAQRNSYANAIVDLLDITCSSGPYVMLSRLKKKGGLLILREFPIENLTKPLDNRLALETRKLLQLASKS